MRRFTKGKKVKRQKDEAAFAENKKCFINNKKVKGQKKQKRLAPPEYRPAAHIFPKDGILSCKMPSFTL